MIHPTFCQIGSGILVALFVILITSNLVYIQVSKRTGIRTMEGLGVVPTNITHNSTTVTSDYKNGTLVDTRYSNRSWTENEVVPNGQYSNITYTYYTADAMILEVLNNGWIACLFFAAISYGIGPLINLVRDNNARQDRDKNERKERKRFEREGPRHGNPT